jgi:hypothetical protein
MSAPEGNSLFCFPENLNVSRDEVVRNIEIRLSDLLYSDEQKSTFNNTHTTNDYICCSRAWHSVDIIIVQYPFCCLISIRKWYLLSNKWQKGSVGANEPAGEPCVGGWENFSIVSALLPTDNLA